MRNFLTAFLISTFLCSAQAPQAPVDNPQGVIRSTSQEVLLDVVVRDKKGKSVRDLTAKDFEISDDGEKQTVRSFRFIGGAESSGAGASAPVEVRSNAVDPLRQVRIITLVFNRMGQEARTNARNAVNEMLKSEGGPNLFYAVFSIDQRLSVLQQYTTDKERVRKAIAKILSSESSLFISESDEIQKEVATVAAMDAASAAVPADSNGAPNGGAAAAAVMAQLTLNAMQFSQTMDRTLQGRSDIFALEALINQQYRLPGRKTLIYFCEGLRVPQEYTDEFNGLISSANRYNVSVYGIDARGLNSSAQNGAAGDLLKQATAGTRASTQGSGPVRPNDAQAADRAIDAIQQNSQNSLDDISQKTGGFMVANTNDFKTRLHQVSEDIDTHYELSYSPNIKNFDGHFRTIAVKVDRADTKVQSRSGYYALPFIQGQNLLAYELPMLTVLAAAPLPKDISYRSAGMHFRSSTGKSEGVIVFDVPMENVDFQKNEVAKAYQMHFSVIALVKDAQGTIVQKLSQDVPQQVPLDKIDAFKAGHFIYSKPAALMPGRYTLETAVADRNTSKYGAKKTVIVIPPEDTVGISSVVRVRSVTPKAAGAAASPTDPFDVSTGKISPGLDETVKGGPGQTLSFFYTIYTPAGTKTVPDVSMEFYKDGQLLGKATPPLPVPDAQGTIPYIASFPLDPFKPGSYELKVVVSMNGKVASERAGFTVE